MSEPEDLILDGAYVASRFARDLWRKYAPPPTDSALRLADVRVRLELFLHALFEREIPIGAAEPPAPASWLGRIAGRGPEANTEGVPGTDGTRIYLPARLATALSGDIHLYTLLAVEQAVRLVRRSAVFAAAIELDEVRHRFDIAEATAIDVWIVRETPGLLPALRAARRDALAKRSRTPPAARRGRWIEELLRDWLTHDPLERCDWVPLCATPSASLACSGSNRWPRSRTATRQGQGRSPSKSRSVAANRTSCHSNADRSRSP